MSLKEILKNHINPPQKCTENVSLRKYFTAYTIGFFLLLSVLLGVIFISHEKNLLSGYAVSSTEEFVKQLYNRYEKDIILELEGKNGPGLVKGSEEYNRLDNMIKGYLVDFTDIMKIKLYNSSGIVVYSTVPDDVGRINAKPEFKKALSGKVLSKLVEDMSVMTSEGAESEETYEADVIEVHVPVITMNDGKVIGIFEVYRDVSAVFDASRKGGYKIGLLFVLSLGTLFVIWQMILKKADWIIELKTSEINRNNKELEEAQLRITESIDDVIKHKSFHVRYDNKKLLKCWEFKNCTKTDCPGYKSENLRCWQLAGTFCGGVVQGFFAKKYGDCRKCDVFKTAFNSRINSIGESFNNMMTLLENKQIELEESNKKLNILVDIDPLTQIGNRRSFQSSIDKIHLLSLRYNRPYSIIICDVDNFKLYNDTYGHQMGDYVLISVANAMKSSIRKTDEVFRWGGEEFIVILPEQSHEDALKVGENLRSSVHDIGIEHEKSDFHVITMSLGVASFYPANTKELTWEAVVKKADEAMYRAKSSKKNCVYSAATV